MKYLLQILIILFFSLFSISQNCNEITINNTNDQIFYIDSNSINLNLKYISASQSTKPSQHIWQPDSNTIINQNNLITIKISNPGIYKYTLYRNQFDINSLNLIQNGSFEKGNLGFNSELMYVTPVKNNIISNGIYSIVDKNQLLSSLNNSFSNCQPVDSNKFFIAFGNNKYEEILWSQKVPVTKNKFYYLEYFASSFDTVNSASINLSINDNYPNNYFPISSANCNWQGPYFYWNSGLDTIAEIKLNNYYSPNGCHILFDNISLSEAITDSCKVIFEVKKITNNNFISGRVLNCCSKPISNSLIKLIINNNIVKIDTTDELGYYSFDSIPIIANPTNEKFRVELDYNKNEQYCTNTKDLILFKKDFLQILNLNKYQKIVADVNDSGNLTTLDLVNMQQVILQINPNYSNGNILILNDYKNTIYKSNFISIPSNTVGPYKDLNFIYNYKGDLDCSCKY